jgi:hypothetical protein
MNDEGRLVFFLLCHGSSSIAHIGVYQLYTQTLSNLSDFPACHGQSEHFKFEALPAQNNKRALCVVDLLGKCLTYSLR